LKYKILTSNYLQINGTKRLPVKVYKIFALKTFEVLVKGSYKNNYEDRRITVKEGDIGGYIQSETNLPHDDNSWVFNTACVFENAVLSNSAILDNAKVCDNAKVTNSTIRGKARIFGGSTVTDTFADDNVDVSEGSQATNSYLYNASRINGQSKVDRTKMFLGARVNKRSQAINCELTDQSEVTDGAVCTNCKYSGQTFVRGGTHTNETLSQEVQLDIVSVADQNRKDF